MTDAVQSSVSREDSDDLEILERQHAARRGRSAGPVGLMLTLAVVAGLGGVAWVGAGVVWRLVYPTPLPVADLQPAPGSAGAVDRSFKASDLEALVSAHLFGEPPAAVPSAAPPPETPLNLSLKGIMHSDVAEDARAIIAAPDLPQRAYGVRDALPGNARIVEIRQDLVVLERNGLRESLRLESMDGSQGQRGQSAPDRRYDERGNASLAQALRGFQARLQTDPESAMSLIRLVPERNGDRMLGVRIYPGPEGGLFQQAGLEAGDLVTHVNTIEIDSTVRGLEALRALTAARELSLSVRRGERRLAFSYSVAR